MGEWLSIVKIHFAILSGRVNPRRWSLKWRIKSGFFLHICYIFSPLLVLFLTLTPSLHLPLFLFLLFLPLTLSVSFIPNHKHILSSTVYILLLYFLLWLMKKNAQKGLIVNEFLLQSPVSQPLNDVPWCIALLSWTHSAALR